MISEDLAKMNAQPDYKDDEDSALNFIRSVITSGTEDIDTPGETPVATDVNVALDVWHGIQIMKYEKANSLARKATHCTLFFAGGKS